MASAIGSSDSYKDFNLAPLVPVQQELPFERLEQKIQDLADETIRDHGFQFIKKIEAEHQNIEREDAPSEHLVDRIDDIVKRCMDFKPLPQHKRKQLSELKISLDCALQPLQSIRRRLTAAERRQSEARQEILSKVVSRGFEPILEMCF